MQPNKYNQFLRNMKSLAFILIFPFLVKAQQQQPSTNAQLIKTVNFWDNQPDQIVKTNVEIQSENIELAIRDYLMKNLTELANPNTGLVLGYYKEGALGHHYYFKQTYNGVEVYNGYIKVNQNNNGLIYSYSNHLIHLNGISMSSNSSSFVPDFLVLHGNELVKLKMKNHILFDEQGAVIKTIDPKFYVTVDDTLVKGKVFNHDPLTVSGVIYGQDGTWKHFNDSNYSLLNDKRVTVSFPATLTDSGKFVLKSKYGIIQNIAPPSEIIASSAVPMFDFLRKSDQFKEVMAYYHVLHTRDYFMSLGFTNRMQYQQRIDALSGYGDNSFFSPDDTTLNFGIGGIPDAEDADVPSHEFTHAMSFDIAPTPVMNVERRSIEEGMCDVTAAIQSYKTTTFNWRLLYNFDGPNPVATGASSEWGGRSGQSYKTYLDLIGSPYKDCEIWSSCLLDIAEHSTIGHDTLMILMLNSIYHFTQTTTMPQAAQVMLDTDSILFGGRHRLIMGYYYNLRHFGTFPQGIQSVAGMPSWIRLINTAGFADGESKAIIQNNSNAAYQLQIIDLTGKTILNQFVNEANFSLVPDQFKSGMYILQITQNGNLFTQKLVR